LSEGRRPLVAVADVTAGGGRRWRRRGVGRHKSARGWPSVGCGSGRETPKARPHR